MTASEEPGVGHVLSYSALPINGIEDLTDAVAGTHLEPTLLKPGLLKGPLVHAVCERATLSSGAFRGEAHVTGPLSTANHTVGVLLDTEGANSQWAFETKGGDIAIVPPILEHDARHGKMTHWVTLSLPLEDILMRAEIGQPHLTEAFFEETAMYRPAPHIAQRTIKSFRTALREMTQNPSLIRSSRALNAMFDELIGSSRRAFGRVGENPIERRSMFVNARRIVEHSREYLRTHNDRPVRLPELCQHLGVSERNLNRAFREVLDLPPAAYLRRWRLCQVRQMLAQTKNVDMTVADAGLHFGFWELGRFAAQYKQLFGEYPSQTLMRGKKASFG